MVNMKKKNILLFIIILITFPVFAQVEGQTTELEIYNELNIYTNAKYFPGVLEQAEIRTAVHFLTDAVGNLFAGSLGSYNLSIDRHTQPRQHGYGYQ